MSAIIPLPMSSIMAESLTNTFKVACFLSGAPLTRIQSSAIYDTLRRISGESTFTDVAIDPDLVQASVPPYPQSHEPCSAPACPIKHIVPNRRKTCALRKFPKNSSLKKGSQ
jgi:hypothetical protein